MSTIVASLISVLLLVGVGGALYEVLPNVPLLVGKEPMPLNELFVPRPTAVIGDQEPPSTVFVPKAPEPVGDSVVLPSTLGASTTIEYADVLRNKDTRFADRILSEPAIKEQLTRDQFRRADASDIFTALELYKVDFGFYPRDLQSLSPAYVLRDEIILDPQTSEPYLFATTDPLTSYELCVGYETESFTCYQQLPEIQATSTEAGL